MKSSNTPPRRIAPLSSNQFLNRSDQRLDTSRPTQISRNISTPKSSGTRRVMKGTETVRLKPLPVQLLLYLVSLTARQPTVFFVRSNSSTVNATHNLHTS